MKSFKDWFNFWFLAKPKPKKPTPKTENKAAKKRKLLEQGTSKVITLRMIRTHQTLMKRGKVVKRLLKRK